MSANNLQDKNSAGRGGMSTLDLLGGSVAVNRVVKMMLRKNRMTYQELCAAIDELPPEKQMSREELDNALLELTGKDWLTKTIEDGVDVYQVLLRPKVSSAEQLHSDNLPQIDVAVDKNINPNLQGTSSGQTGASGKKNGLLDVLRRLFGAKK